VSNVRIVITVSVRIRVSMVFSDRLGIGLADVE